MNLKNRLISVSVIFLIIFTILCLLITGNSVPSNTYLSNGSVDNTERTVDYTNKGPDTNKISQIQSMTDSRPYVHISIPDDEKPEGRGTYREPYIIMDAGDLRWLTNRVGYGESGSNTNIYVELGADIDMSKLTTKARALETSLTHNGYKKSGSNYVSTTANHIVCTNFLEVKEGEQIDSQFYAQYQTSTSDYFYTIFPFDSSKKMIKSGIKEFTIKYNTNVSTWYTVPAGVKYIKIQVWNTASANINSNRLGYTSYKSTNTVTTYNTYSWMPIGNDIKPFSGYFDGKNHTISNLTISTNLLAGAASDYTMLGLFGRVSGGEYKNVNIVNSCIEGTYTAGEVHLGLFMGGSTGRVSLDNITVGANVPVEDEGSYISGTFPQNARVGGVIGSAVTTALTNLKNYAWVQGNSSYMGGIAGYVSGLTHFEYNNSSNLYNYGRVKKNNNSSADMGGIFGAAEYTNLENSANYGNVTGAVAGGIVGKMKGGTIENCVNNAVYVEGKAGIGGIVGKILEGVAASVIGCTNNGRVATTQESADYDSDVRIGGIVGSIDEDTVVTRKKYISGCVNNGQVNDSQRTTDTGNGNANVIRMGGIVGASFYAYIIECENNGAVSTPSYEVGGVIGYAAVTDISKCYNNGRVQGASRVGGIFGNFGGRNTNVTVSDCFNQGTISANKTNGGYDGAVAGGIAGRYDASLNTNSTFIRCINIGTVTGNNAGGLAGWAKDLNSNNLNNYLLMDSCYNAGEVNGKNYAGGIFGVITSSTAHKTGVMKVMNVYNSGQVNLTGSGQKGSFAALIYNNANAKPELNVSNFYAYYSSGTPYSIVNQNGNGSSYQFNLTGISESTSNLVGSVNQSDFAGFDFGADETWGIVPGYNNGLPYIRAIDEIELTFDYNTVGIENETIIVLYGTGSYTLSNTVYNEDAKYGYKVNNWTLSEDGSGTSYANGDSIPVQRLRDMVIYANYVGAPYTIKIAGITSTIGGALTNVSGGAEVTIKEDNGDSKIYDGTFTIESSSNYNIVASGDSTVSGATFNFAGWNVLTSDGSYAPVIYGDTGTTLSLYEVFSRMTEGWDSNGVITLVPKTGNIITLSFEVDGVSRGVVQVNGVSMNFGGNSAAYAGTDYTVSSTLASYYEVEEYTVNYPAVSGISAKEEKYTAQSFALSLDSRYEGAVITITVKYRAMDLTFTIYAIDTNQNSIGNPSEYVSLTSGTFNVNGRLSENIEIFETQRYRFSELRIMNRRTSENYTLTSNDLSQGDGYVLRNDAIAFDENFLYNYSYENEVVIYLVYDEYYLINVTSSEGGYLTIFIDEGNGYIESAYAGLEENTGDGEENEKPVIISTVSLYLKSGVKIRIDATASDAYKFNTYTVDGPLYTIIGTQLNFVASEDTVVLGQFGYVTYTIKYIAKTDGGSTIGVIDGGIFVNGEKTNIAKLGDIVTLELPPESKYKLLNIKLTLNNGSEIEVGYDDIKSFTLTKDAVVKYFNEKNIATITATYSRQRTFTVNIDDISSGSVACYIVEGDSETPFNAVIGETYIFNANTVIKIVATPAKYYEFNEFKGQITASEITADDNIVNVKLSSDRIILVSFKPTEYFLEIIDASGENVNGEFSAKSRNIKIGDTVVLTFSPNNGYAIRTWTINGIDVLAENVQDNIVFSGNTVSITIDAEWLDRFTDNKMTSVVTTQISPLVMGIVIGGGAGILLLVAILIILMVLSQKQNKKIKEELLEENKDKMKFIGESNIVGRLKTGENVTQIKGSDIKAAKKAKKEAKKNAKNR